MQRISRRRLITGFVLAAAASLLLAVSLVGLSNHNEPTKTPSAVPVVEVQPPPTVLLRVNYDLSLRQMIAAGRFGKGIDIGITAEHFPVKPGPAKVEAVLVSLRRGINTGQVRAALHRQGLRSATMPELLAFAAQYLNRPVEYDVYALGSSWSQTKYFRNVGSIYDVGHVYYDEYGRYLGLEQVFSQRTWPATPGGSALFLAVRE
ncbi:MAG TPA: hypothetical protein VMR98_05105 [Candidatus Polarisedimenticolaceae bacterium]|nr:hypothetical protein [Candidatus Polarisedimenticolaceae bacterium]